MQSVMIGANQAGQRFDKFLHKYLPNASSSFLYKMLRKKNITLNGKKAEGKEMLKEGDEVKLFFADETFAKFVGLTTENPKESSQTQIYENAFRTLKGITVIYEDEHVLILNKPSGILTQKAEPTDISLNEWMIGYLLEEQKILPEGLRTFKPSVCNRLDRNTSGLVLCGKSLPGSQGLSKLIHDRTLRKFYRTIVGGVVSQAEKIEGLLIKDEKTNKVEVYKSQKQPLDKDTDWIRTAYTPLALLGNRYTYLEVELVTGKTHQIRAHLASEGYPLIGDYKYGNHRLNETFKKQYSISSQLLHAYRLEFPKLEGALSGLSGSTIYAPLPTAINKILKDYKIEVN